MADELKQIPYYIVTYYSSRAAFAHWAFQTRQSYEAVERLYTQLREEGAQMIRIHKATEVFLSNGPSL